MSDLIQEDVLIMYFLYQKKYYKFGNTIFSTIYGSFKSQIHVKKVARKYGRIFLKLKISLPNIDDLLAILLE